MGLVEEEFIKARAGRLFWLGHLYTRRLAPQNGHSTALTVRRRSKRDLGEG
jgi:hypothetical protein